MRFFSTNKNKASTTIDFCTMHAISSDRVHLAQSHLYAYVFNATL